MNVDMKKWVAELIAAPVKKPMPLLSFPCVQLMDVTVHQLVSAAALQAKGMKLVADRVPSCASVSLMDLSVEAEAFGANIRVSDDEVPTVIGSIVNSSEDADNLEIPELTKGRCLTYISAIKEACKVITDRPVFAGVIGPFSLAGRLMNVSEAMINCYTEPEMVHTTLEKVTQFLITYINAYKDAGANGIVMAEPLAGILSPDMAREFSEPYVRKIAEAVQDDEFMVIYHNCGDNILLMIDSILATGADAYHFGNVVEMKEMMKKIPSDTIAMGNVDPAGQIKSGTPESVKKETLRIMSECCSYPNFIISSGCDIPPSSPMENINAFFEAVDEFYKKI